MIVIRDAAPEDHFLWRFLWGQYCAFYKAEVTEYVTAKTWARILDPASPISCLMAFEGEEPLGFATYHAHPSTWSTADDCYLEDLFVAQSARGKGIGRALIDALREIGQTRGWNRLYWHTDADNHPARRLYDSYALSDGALRYRIKL